MRFARFLAVVLIALSAGMALCHLLESPARLAYPPELWVEVTVAQGTYDMFGPSLGAMIEGAACLAAMIVALLAWIRGRTRGLTTLAAVMMIGALAASWIWIDPAEAALSGVAPDRIPAGFQSLRQRWEYTHGARAVMQIIALVCLAGAAELTPRRLRR